MLVHACLFIQLFLQKRLQFLVIFRCYHVWLTLYCRPARISSSQKLDQIQTCTVSMQLFGDIASNVISHTSVKSVRKWGSSVVPCKYFLLFFCFLNFQWQNGKTTRACNSLWLGFVRTVSGIPVCIMHSCMCNGLSWPVCNRHWLFLDWTTLGPFWVCTTLIFTIAIFGNLSSYFDHRGKGDWKYDFHVGMYPSYSPQGIWGRLRGSVAMLTCHFFWIGMFPALAYISFGWLNLKDFYCFLQCSRQGFLPCHNY